MACAKQRWVGRTQRATGCIYTCIVDSDMRATIPSPGNVITCLSTFRILQGRRKTCKSKNCYMNKTLNCSHLHFPRPSSAMVQEHARQDTSYFRRSVRMAELQPMKIVLLISIDKQPEMEASENLSCDTHMRCFDAGKCCCTPKHVTSAAAAKT